MKSKEDNRLGHTGLSKLVRMEGTKDEIIMLISRGKDAPMTSSSGTLGWLFVRRGMTKFPSKLSEGFPIM
jgi:hypothetical protein